MANSHFFLKKFDKFKSVMPGFISGNRVIFSNVPRGESVKIVSVGFQNNKPVLAVQAVQLSQGEFNGLKFENTSPAAFKEDLKGFK